MNTAELTAKLKEIALKSGVDLVGVASAELLEKSGGAGHRPSDLLPNAKSVVVLAGGRRLNEDRYYFYHRNPYWTINIITIKPQVEFYRMKIRPSIKRVAKFLEKEGYKTIIERGGWSDTLSFRMAMYLAGLGVLGKGNFIINPKYGPLNVTSCIATDAPLEPDQPISLDLCGDCLKCIKACKYGAFKKDGDSFKWKLEKCRAFTRRPIKVWPIWRALYFGPCNSACLNVCPIGNQQKSL